MTTEEEFWPAPSLLTEHTIHTIRFDGGKGNNEPLVLRYKSMASDELTPLDMVYGSGNEAAVSSNTKSGGDYDPFRDDDEFYDGTGNLMWMAAICFGHLLDQRVEPLRSYLFEGSPPARKTTPTISNPGATTRRFCELGCGTGGAGISLLLSSPGTSSCHVVFTDNDSQSLDLCESNCELNQLDPETYSSELLGWGSEHLPSTTTTGHGGGNLELHSFDVVLATDVIYDLKMIAPLFETVDGLLKTKQEPTKKAEDGDKGDHGGGHLVLSHVPRFCIPRHENECHRGEEQPSGEDSDHESPPEAFMELERLIRSEALRVGLILVESIRPHEVLSSDTEEGPGSKIRTESDIEDGESDDDSMQKLTLETMKEAHAVVFVFGRI